jgi:ribonuclease-3
MTEATSESGSPLEQAVGHRFRQPRLLGEALTHSSAAGGAARRGGVGQGYERLEFLGDRVLGLVVADMLFRRFSSEEEGALARRLAVLVSSEALARVADVIELGRHLVLAKGEEESGGRANPATLADACEALIAALYLDGGLTAARGFVERHWTLLMDQDLRPPQDAKTALQEWAQGAGLPLPAYTVVATAGPAHEPLFTIEVRVEGHQPAVASGRSKRAAEQAAASSLLGRLSER